MRMLRVDDGLFSWKNKIHFDTQLQIRSRIVNGCSILANLTVLNLFSLYNQLNNYNEQTKVLIMYRKKLKI